MSEKEASSFDAGYVLREVWVPISQPKHRLAKDMAAFWQTRPKDGIVVGRDIPSRRIAKLLGNIMLWEPVGDCEDMRMLHMGEGMRLRFGGNVTGQMLSQLVATEVCAYHCGINRELLKTDGIAMYDIKLVRDIGSRGNLTEVVQAHYEMVVVTALKPATGRRVIFSGAFYF